MKSMKKCKKHGTKLITKMTLFIVWELKQEGRGWPCVTSAENVHIGDKFFATLCMSENDYKTTTCPTVVVIDNL
jgi:hypothetical protein